MSNETPGLSDEQTERRETFEKWAGELEYDLRPMCDMREDLGDDYISPSTINVWSAWCAAWQARGAIERAAGTSAQPVLDHVECKNCGNWFGCEACGSREPELHWLATPITGRGDPTPLESHDKEDAADAESWLAHQEAIAESEGTGTSAQPEPVRAALAELVACEDFRAMHTDESGWLNGHRRREYGERAPLAWEAARRALAQSPETDSGT